MIKKLIKLNLKFRISQSLQDLEYENQLVSKINFLELNRKKFKIKIMIKIKNFLNQLISKIHLRTQYQEKKINILE